MIIIMQYLDIFFLFGVPPEVVITNTSTLRIDRGFSRVKQIFKMTLW